MSSSLPPNPWTRREPWFRCPVTALWTPQSERVWSRGRWVNRRAFDVRGFDEAVDTSTPDLPIPQRETPRNLDEV